MRESVSCPSQLGRIEPTPVPTTQYAHTHTHTHTHSLTHSLTHTHAHSRILTATPAPNKEHFRRNRRTDSRKYLFGGTAPLGEPATVCGGSKVVLA